MSSSSRAAESRRVELVYYWALNTLTNHAGQEALRLWAQVPATPQAAGSTWWLTELLKMLLGFRSEAQALALAYYRFQRALQTGETIALPGEADGSSTTIGALRQEFLDAVDAVEAMVSGGVITPEPTLPDIDDGPIKVRRVGDIDALIRASDEAAIDEAADDLDGKGIGNLIDKLEELEAGLAHAQAGRRSTAAFERITMNAARGLVYDLAGLDPYVVGYVRYSQTGHPCGWCAMLISRGLVYKSASTASGKGSGSKSVRAGLAQESDQYHDNCRCVAVPIFSLEQYEQSELFDLNRELDDLWQSLKDTDPRELIKQYGTAELLAIFRKIMRLRQATAAPEAA